MSLVDFGVMTTFRHRGSVPFPTLIHTAHLCINAYVLVGIQCARVIYCLAFSLVRGKCLC